MDDRQIVKKAYLHGIVVFAFLYIINKFLNIFGIFWAVKPYGDIIIILFSCIVSFSEITLRINKRVRYKKNRFTYIMIGTISSITVISYLRDMINHTVKIVENGKLTAESCICLIGLIFMILFFSYLYKEFKIGKEMNSR